MVSPAGSPPPVIPISALFPVPPAVGSPSCQSYDRSDPTAAVMDVLDRHIKPGGTVIVWNASFERVVSKEIGERLGDLHVARIDQINGMMRDLRDVFSKQHYVHPEFRGGTSIKDVLPVLVPELSYAGLAIIEGTMASEQ